ncbi:MULTISPECIES: class I SAM-dependent RNA methyltransferase [Streptomyces]|uniref:Class I SAM-dependent RNA methyltransferase n=1 Tax=Streptomyces tsukubensis (strain DSM 42081 / NBRC 108919 / NRRL 18488 / 9993) TaxID=1114943 RepID=I2N856_STRT9|nr:MULTISPECIES: TRAM domain-containing protein [Streptomyces]AZK97113.1 RNA methyltransferase [Streptomyces tsukubensis]EIF93203.1 RNA methyltransferase [Streptomyces tsukubensis NRRL18488]MYS67953.1 TRAM domain-containing protein [Streptomyces sp. SID5473]QKM66916.1 class I SAM-dependent RNA methyltransferase [Streptomyces tsukubensis NRRL18488]TAI44736.1 class I SAM-dependent RNA methyltransferase [Streptomyces tsukubensis]
MPHDTSDTPSVSAPSLVGEEYEVEVGPVAHGGHCIARTDEGRVLFVRHSLPGEKVIAKITEGDETSRFLRADAVRILAPAKDRVEAPCPFSGPGRCGGCDWQHVKPGAQRRFKGEVIAEQLQRLAGLTPEEAGWDGTVMPAEGDKLPAGQVPAWRTRVQYAIDTDGRAGLRRHRSHEVERIDHCMIAAPGVDELGVEKREWPGMASVEAIAATGSHDRQVVLTPRPGARLPLVELDRPVSVLRVDEHDAGVHRVHGRAFVRERADGRTYRVGNGGFWQVHPQAADTLVKAVMQGLMPRKGETALDLYCGVGLFAGAIAERVGEQGAVLGVESSKRAVEDARHNLDDLPRVRIEHGRVDRVLPRTGITETDLIVLDPPRAGAGKQTVRHLASLAARRIAYVACDPAALARDLAYFREEGYRTRTLRAFDLFPMTHHVECVAILEPAAKGS